MPDNVVILDLARFTDRDIARIAALAGKLKLMHRWYRCERSTLPGADRFVVFSGDRSQTPYACYRIERIEDGAYRLVDHRSGEMLAASRSIGPILDALPADFYHAAPAPSADRRPKP